MGRDNVEITDVRLTLAEARFPGDAILAYCAVTVDNSFVVHDIKVVRGRGGPFLSMPSRKITDRCASCGWKNPVDSRHCGGCGCPTDQERWRKNGGKLHLDLFHPVDPETRRVLTEAVLATYREEVKSGPKNESKSVNEARTRDRNGG